MLSRPLQPRPVDPRSWQLWLKQSLALVWRRWPWLLLSAAGTLLLFGLTDRLLAAQPGPLRGFVSLTLTLFYTAAGVWLIEAADRSLSVAALLRERLTSGLGPLLQIAGVMIALFLSALFIGATVLGLLNYPLPDDATSGTATADYALLGFITPLKGWLFFLLLPCCLGSWFLLPLAISAGCSLPLAWRLAHDGWLLNRFIWRPAVILLVLALALPALALLLLMPLLSALFYVSYRHVYLGQAENQPLVAAKIWRPLATN